MKGHLVLTVAVILVLAGCRKETDPPVEPEVEELFESLVHREERDEILLKKIKATHYF